MRRILSSLLLFFLFALPLTAQDGALTGSWETNFTEPEVGDITIRLTFEEGGGFQLDQVITASDDFLAEAGDAAPPIEEFTAQGTGTYRVEGDSLFADLTKLSMYVDGRDFVEVMTEFARAFARIAADLGGVSDEEYPAFEQAAVEEFLAGFNPEEEFLGDFTGNLGTYRIDGDILSITTTPVDGEAETVELMRIDSSTAVASTTWGNLKADMRL